MARKNQAAVALSALRMKRITPARRLEISRAAAKAAGVVHSAKALARKALREAQAAEEAEAVSA